MLLLINEIPVNWYDRVSWRRGSCLNLIHPTLTPNFTFLVFTLSLQTWKGSRETHLEIIQISHQFRCIQICWNSWRKCSSNAHHRNDPTSTWTNINQSQLVDVSNVNGGFIRGYLYFVYSADDALIQLLKHKLQLQVSWFLNTSSYWVVQHEIS